MKRFHKLTAWLLTLAMLMTFIPTFSQMGTGLTVYATEGTGSDSDDSELGGGTGGGGGEAGSGGSSGTEGDGTEVSYLAPVYEDGKIMFDENNDVVFETKTVTDYIVAEDIAYGNTITSADKMPTVGTSGDTTWYVADSDIEWENFVLVQGDVHLVICDDITITSMYGIVVSNGNSLTIYGQENGTGTLVAKGVNYSGGFYSAAIGGCDVTTEMANGGAITINGGIISASASPNAAAIGGSKRGTGGTITINGGSVDAKGGAYSAAIGGGSGGNSGNIIINGGIVSAETSGSSSAIGAGYVRYSSTGESILAKTDKIEINGGTVVATHTDSYAEYPVIGGLYGFDNINIRGGHITVSHASSGGIGIGTNSVTAMGFDGNLNISGGTIISGTDKTLYLGAGKTSSSAKGTVDVVVTGGNISGTFKNASTLTDGKSAVEMKEITVDGAEDQTEVTVLEDYPTYGLCDVVTDGDKVVIYVPVSKAYTVTVSDTIANGTVTADVSEASEGDTVTLTVTPDEGYELSEIVVSDEFGMYIPVNDDNTFIMPADDVTVAAEFVKTQNDYSIVGSFNGWDVRDTSYTMTMNSDGKYVIATEIEGGNYEFKIAKNYDWEDSLGVSDIEDAISNGETVALVENGENNLYFELAETSEVTFVFDPVAMTLTVSWEEYVPTLFEVIIAETQNGSVSASPDFTVPGDTVILTVTPDAGFEIDTISYNDGTDDIEIIATGGVYSFTMPASDVTVTATFKEAAATSHVNHPVCGATHTDIGDHVGECEAIGWTAWDGTTALGEGNYYLAKDIEVYEGFAIDANTNLCLNGHTIKFIGGDYSLFDVLPNASLAISDCDGNGAITDSHFLRDDCIYLYNGANLSFFGGNITGNTFGYASCISGNGTINIYGGNISGNNFEVDYAYDVEASYGSTLSIYGGKIGKVYGDVTLSGSPEITGYINLTGQIYFAGEMTNTTPIPIYMGWISNTVNYISENGGEYVDKFTAYTEDCFIANDNGKLTYNAPVEVLFYPDDMSFDPFVTYKIPAGGGKLPEIPEAPAKQGYEFVGWSNYDLEGHYLSPDMVFLQYTYFYPEYVPFELSAVKNENSYKAVADVGTLKENGIISWHHAEIISVPVTTDNASVMVGTWDENGNPIYSSYADGKWIPSGGSYFSIELEAGDIVTITPDVKANYTTNFAGSNAVQSIAPDGSYVYTVWESGTYGFAMYDENWENANIPISVKLEKFVIGEAIEGETSDFFRSGEYGKYYAVKAEFSDGAISASKPFLYEIRNYNVTINTAENGTVEADKKTAAEGETVTITLTPADRYEPGTLTVKDESGEPVPVTNNTFTMPASLVTVYATFVKSSIEVQFEVVKEINDWNAEGSFTFKLQAVTEGAPMPANASAVATEAMPSASFGTIVYDEIGTYEYTITEVQGSLLGMSYDPTPHTVIVTVTQGADYKLSATVTYDGEDQLIITNTYTPMHSVRISAVDIDDGFELEGATLQILNENGSIIDEWVSTKEPHTVEALRVNETYTIQAAAAPSEYKKCGGMTFRMDATHGLVTYGSVTEDGVLLVEFAPVGFIIEAERRFDNETRENILFEICDAENEVVALKSLAEFDDWAWKVTGLSTGNDYTVRVTNAPWGYANPADISVSIDRDGNVTINGTPSADGVIFVTFEEISPAIHEIVFNSDSDAYDAETNTFYYDSQHTLNLVINGQDLIRQRICVSLENSDGNLLDDYVIAENNTSISKLLNAAALDAALDTFVAAGLTADIVKIRVVIDGLPDAPTYLELNIKPKKYSITLDSNGANIEPVTIDTDYRKLTALPTPERSGYAFNGWFDAQIGGNEITTDTVFTQDTTIYAQWTKLIPKITGIAIDATSSAYDAATDTFTVAKDKPFVVVLRGEHFANIDDEFLEANAFGFVPSVDDSENAFGNALQVLKEAGLAIVDAEDNRIKLTFDYDMMKAFLVEHERLEGICYGDIENIREENIASVNIAFAKYDPVYTEPTVKTGLVYNGAEQELLIPGTAEGGTMKYYIGGTEATAEVPTRKAAGEYTVTCIIAGDSFHNNIVVGEYTVAIAKKTINSAIVLTAPVKNTAPQTEITGTGYTATVVWSPDVNDKFGYNTEYTATITITVDENHTVTGITANGYTVEGAKTVTNDENSNVVTVAYEKTGSRPSSGGGGSSSNTTTTTTKNEDGSTTKVTENKTTGTKTEVTTNTDGSTTTVETKKDGTTVTTETTADGETKTEIELPKDKETEVTIPAPNAEDVTSVTVTDKDGKETEITDFEITEDGVKLTVSGDCTAVINKAAKKEFADVHPVNHWATADIDYAYIKGLMMGTSETHFSPDVPLTRAMLVTVLYRLEGEPEMKNAQWFEDVEKGLWYSDAVAWATFNGITMGYGNGNFGPDDYITREQIAAIMHRYAQYKGYDVSVGENTNILSYDDFAHISEYAIASMQYACGSGLMKGKTASTLNPLDNATRAEIAAILHRFIEANK